MMYCEIEEIVCSHFGVTPDDIRGRCRTRPIEDARHYVWYVLFFILGIKVTSIANEYGVTRRNVYYALNGVHDGIRLQRFYAKHFREIQASLLENRLI